MRLAWWRTLAWQVLWPFVLIGAAVYFTFFR
jgi:hypothetical protein